MNKEVEPKLLSHERAKVGLVLGLLGLEAETPRNELMYKTVAEIKSQSEEAERSRLKEAVEKLKIKPATIVKLNDGTCFDGEGIRGFNHAIDQVLKLIDGEGM